MYEHERTTFARYPFIPTKTSMTEFLAIYASLCPEQPWFHTSDLERDVYVIDVRRFHPDLIEDALFGAELSPHYDELRDQLRELLDELRAEYGDPSRWEPQLYEMPPLFAPSRSGH